MSYWDSGKQKVIRFKPKFNEHYPKWIDVDCGCCAGLEWGGEEPRECDYCRGTGWYSTHTTTGTCALYPGGPLLGARQTPNELKLLIAAAEKPNND